MCQCHTKLNEAECEWGTERDAFGKKEKKALSVDHSKNLKIITSDNPPCLNPRNRPLHVLCRLFDLQL